MNVSKLSIVQNESSYNVTLVHQILSVLGFPPDKKEIAERKAGSDTRAKLTELRAQLDLPAATPKAPLVDAALAEAIIETLRKRGLTDTASSFTVSGVVRGADGTPKRQQRVMAFDLDLKGVAIYRTVETLEQMDTHGGFEFLGEAVSDPHGAYRITFYEWQYRRAERKKADVVVFAVAEGGRILGRSALIDSAAYSAVGVAQNLDVMLAQVDTRPEYERVMSALTPFLEENEVSLDEVAGSADQLSFTASELDLEPEHVAIAATAQRLVSDDKVLHEVLYGIGRQDIALTWSTLATKTAAALSAALGRSSEQHIIRPLKQGEADALVQRLRERAAAEIAGESPSEGTLKGQKLLKSAVSAAVRTVIAEKPFQAILDPVLPRELSTPAQRRAFIEALGTFEGKDYREFWHKHLAQSKAFRDDPQLVPKMLLTQQLSLLSGNHHALVNELLGVRKIGSAKELLAMTQKEWLEVVKKVGVPEFIAGASEEARAKNYVDILQSTLDAAFPTQRIALMAARGELPIQKSSVARAITTFLDNTPKFDIASSRVQDFEAELAAVAGNELQAAQTELKKIQRVFQVSPTPAAMTALLKAGLHSAHAIASMPRKSFIAAYGDLVGGASAAFAIHQRAEHIAQRAEHTVMRLLEYTQAATPAYAMDAQQRSEAMLVLSQHLPNYAELFGSPDLCECEHCRSVYGPAAYFVDLLRFLARSKPNDDDESPLEKLKARRPDLLELKLTCENTNTIIPYVDLANEVMEYYAAHSTLTGYRGHDTGDATEAELRANPQHFNLEAYRTLSRAKYPFSLPYHQPLDVIRTYSDHLKVSRHEVLKAVNPTPNAMQAAAIAAESLRLSQEEHRILTGVGFDGTADTTPLHEYFGYANAAELDGMSAVREFLARSGITYPQLIELVETHFVNPHRWTLDFLSRIFASSPISAASLYAKLGQIETGALSASADADITAALAAYNAAAGTDITAAQFDAWVTRHLGEFRQVITLYQPESRCDLDTTSLRTIANAYSGETASGLTNGDWTRIHRFIRLWNRLGWTIRETDLMLSALSQTQITAQTIERLEAVLALKDASKLGVEELGVLWGPIDHYGEKSLYRKLFLNKAVQQIDPAFEADAWGQYLTDPNEVLADHRSAILAAFRIREEDLDAIVEVARVRDNGALRPLDLATDRLSLPNLSTLYRHVVLARALKMHVPELVRLMQLFGASPFSVFDVQLGRFDAIAPADTLAFYELAESTKQAGFKVPVVDYILTGSHAPDSRIGLDRSKAVLAGRAIRQSFAAIDLDHPDVPPTPLTSNVLASKLALTYEPQIAMRLLEILAGTATFETVTDANLNISIPANLAARYAYVKGSGRLTAVGVMSDAERTTLRNLSGSNAFKEAVDRLYAAPERFIATHFGGVFTDLAEAYARLLDHPAQGSPATLDEKLRYVYDRFVPVLKSRLRRDAIIAHLAALIGLNDQATSLLAASDLDPMAASLSQAGFTAEYFSDATWTNLAVTRVDSAVDHDWGSAAPAAGVPASTFSVRWTAYIAPPSSGEYTFVVDVDGADEAFRLYLDEVLILEKPAGDNQLSWEAVAELNAATLHALRLEYAQSAGNAAVRLSWKTATTALTHVPATSAYPAGVLDAFVERARVLHRAAKFIQGFRLTEREIDHFLRFGADFDNLDFRALTSAHWRRMLAYTGLRDAVPQAQALLVDVFALANTTNPAPTVAQLRQLLEPATAWDANDLQYLVDTHFSLNVDAFRNEIALNRLLAVMRIVRKAGISARTVVAWGTVETDFDALHATAQRLKNVVKAKYDESDWLELAGGLSDQIREHQKQALIAYLLTLPDIRAWGARDADGLFEYLLIDVQMCACMDTSRIVQATSSVQMFVNRCLLNLESDTTSGRETGVSPGAIDRDRWEWMKNYRVWQANRKVFLYPENWLDPAWRKDRSEFFREFESYLIQNDINDRSVEQAFRNYLSNLAEVANVEVCGMYQEKHDDGSFKLLHVFARTPHAPYKYFYRTWNRHRKWSAWQKVPVGVRSVETGQESGVHLIPVVWKKRLFLFWPEFSILSQKASTDDSISFEAAAKKSVGSYNAKPYWEIRLAWTEYVDGAWAPKQVSSAVLKQMIGSAVSSESRLRWVHEIDSDQRLSIVCSVEFKGTWVELGRFFLTDIASRIQAVNFLPLTRLHAHGWPGYRNDFMSLSATGRLHLADDDYFGTSVSHRLLVSATRSDYRPSFESPFFFSDEERTYFVRPAEIRVIDHIRFPDLFFPAIPIIIERPTWPLPPPSFGPEELREESIRLVGGQIGLPRASLVAASGVAAAGGPGVTTLQAVSAPAGAAKALARSAVAAEIAYIDRPFGIFDIGAIYGGKVVWRTDTGLEFNTFHHPFAGTFVRNLNERGMAGLMESAMLIPSDEGSTFEDTYKPRLSEGFVRKPADFADHTYYKENVCFDVYGANSLYNWELFFHAPLFIAIRLSRNGQYAEAMKWFHYIFDPTTDAPPGPGESAVSRYWKLPPFRKTPAKTLEEWFRTLGPSADPTAENAIIAEWRDNPFDPHLIASNRPLAYMKYVVIQYVQNLIDWADDLFRQDTMESVNEALQIYVVAKHILGKRPERVPRRGNVKAETYATLEAGLDDFSNALVELENLFPYSSDVPVSGGSAGTNLLGVGPQLYFCIPPNEKLLEYWDKVEDRLYKIRHCQNIDGVERRLALFAPPIDPGALIGAMSQGLSLGSILADLSSPPPNYRFSYLIQRANEFCADVRALGNALLAALEKKDGEELARLRATHEVQLLEAMKTVKERQLLDARARKEALVKACEAAAYRLQHYMELLGEEDIDVPEPAQIGAELTADSPLPADTVIPTVRPDVDVSLVDSDESGVKLIPKEKAEIDKTNEARFWQIAAQAAEGLAAGAHIIPTVTVDGKPFGVGTGASWGGTQLGNALSTFGKVMDFIGAFSRHEAALAAKMAAYIRREQDWAFQANVAAKEIVQLHKQITSADIQIQIAEKELAHHEQQISNARAVEQFLAGKFTNQELYQWLKEQLFALYKQSYNLAYEMAKKAEKAFRYETGSEAADFIQYGYWESSRQGLAAGERLQLALRQLEKAYLDENRRELELHKTVSLSLLDPVALIQLRSTGKCRFAIPEELFDLDFRGHYFRRIRGVRLSIPCIAGPYTSVSCTLRLLNNHIRINTAMNSAGNYEHENDEGVWIDDDRFRTSYVPVTAIATSHAQADSGTFEFSFRDERYLPFEGAGAISEWELELSTEAELRQFDYSTIADVLLHLSYTAREDTGLFKTRATEYLRRFIENAADLERQPLSRMFSLKDEFPTEWHRFLHPASAGGEQVLTFTIGLARMPYFAQQWKIVVKGLEVFAQTTQDSAYTGKLSYHEHDGTPVESAEFAMPKSALFGGLNKATLDGSNSAGVTLEDIDITREISLRMKRAGAAGFSGLASKPEEVRDIYLVLHYKLEPVH